MLCYLSLKLYAPIHVPLLHQMFEAKRLLSRRSTGAAESKQTNPGQYDAAISSTNASKNSPKLRRPPPKLGRHFRSNYTSRNESRAPQAVDTTKTLPQTQKEEHGAGARANWPPGVFSHAPWKRRRMRFIFHPH